MNTADAMGSAQLITSHWESKLSNYNVLCDRCQGKPILVILEHYLDQLLLSQDSMLTTTTENTILYTSPLATVFNILNGTTTSLLPLQNE